MPLCGLAVAGRECSEPNHVACDKTHQVGQNPRRKMIAALHSDNSALKYSRTEQETYPERTGICPRLERYCCSLGRRRRPEILPRWLRGRRGASVVRRDAAINRTEDLKCQRLRRNHHLLRLFPSLPQAPHCRLMTIPRAGALIRAPSDLASSRCCNHPKEQRLRQ